MTAQGRGVGEEAVKNTPGKAASQHLGCSDSPGPNAVMWPQLTTREAGKCSPACAWKEKAMGLVTT